MLPIIILLDLPMNLPMKCSDGIYNVGDFVDYWWYVILKMDSTIKNIFIFLII
jgi:hypothetical protein